MLSINNYTHSKTKALSIRYESSISIRIEVPFSILNSDSTIETFRSDPYYRGKYPERNGATEVSLVDISEQKYHSGDYLKNFIYYAKTTEDIEAIHNLLNLSKASLRFINLEPERDSNE